MRHAPSGPLGHLPRERGRTLAEPPYGFSEPT